MDSVLFGALDVLGLPRFELPAEYIAAWIALLVSPVNYETACVWYHGAQPVENLAETPEIAPIAEGITARQLFALVQLSRVSMTNLDYMSHRERLAEVVDEAVQVILEKKAAQ